MQQHTVWSTHAESGNKFKVAVQSKASEAMTVTLVGRWEWSRLLTSRRERLTANSEYSVPQKMWTRWLWQQPRFRSPGAAAAHQPARRQTYMPTQKQSTRECRLKSCTSNTFLVFVFHAASAHLAVTAFIGGTFSFQALWNESCRARMKLWQSLPASLKVLKAITLLKVDVWWFQWM